MIKQMENFLSLSEEKERGNIIEVCRKMNEKGFIAGTEGNVSVRISPNRILTTPSGLNKGFLKEDDLVFVDMEGKKIKGKYSPSSELKMHLYIYRLREDVRAVVHAHPKTAIAFTIAKMSLALCILPETILSFGEIPTVRYATPTTEDVPMVLGDYILKYNAIMMDRHGSVTMGKNIFEAYNYLEAMEHFAEITFRAKILGPLMPLPPAEIEKLKRMAKDMGIAQIFKSCEGCNVCTPVKKDLSKEDEEIVDKITSAILKNL